MDTNARRPRRARILSLAAVIALVAMFLPALAGVALGHHSIPVVLQIDCNGNVNYTVYDWTTSTGTDGQATFKIYYAVNGGSSWTLLGSASFSSADARVGNVWVVTGSFSVDTSVTSVILRTNNFVWADGPGNTGPWDSSSATRPRACTSPTITTVTGGTVVLGSGAKLTDTATLAGGSNPTGTITFKLYDPTSALRDTEAATVSGNGSYPTPTGFLPDKAGTWHWVASYGGDANNDPVASGANDEPVTVSPTSPTIATTLSKSRAEVGTSVHDSATLTGATATAGGTVTYTVYTNNTCSAGTQDAGTKTVAGGIVPDSNAITFNSAGTWYWQAVYSGDANNTGATSICTEETLVIDPSPSTSAVATPAPSEMVGGATATPRSVTPPPTNTNGGPAGDAIPLFALLICLAFGGLGLLAVQAQRKSIRR